MPRLSRLTLTLLVLILVAGAWTKARMVATAATHVDDLLVAMAILDYRATMDEAALRSRLGEGRPSRVARWLDARGQLKLAARAAPYVSVPYSSTYAPGQFFLTTALLQGGHTYRSTLTRGRLPSLIAGVLAPLFVAIAALRIGGPHAPARALVAAALVACSWELWIFSLQMESYAVGVAGGCVLMILLVTGSARTTARSRVTEGLVVGAVVWLQYQLIFMLPAYVLVRVWQAWRRGVTVRRIVALAAALVPPMAVSALVLFALFLRYLGDAGVNWNAGPQQEFLFRIPEGSGPLGALAYAVSFFSINSAVVTNAMLAFLPEQHAAAGALLLSTQLVLIGVAYAARQRAVESRSALLFTAGVALAWMTLVVAGKLTLSPTRHSLALLPFLALYAAEGIVAIAALTKRTTLVASIAAAAIAGAFLMSYPAEASRRGDPFDESRLRALVGATGAEALVAHTCTRNMLLMGDLGAPLFDWNCGVQPRWKGDPPAAPSRILFVSAREPLRRETVLEAGRLTAMLGAPEDYDWSVLAADPGERPLEASSRTINGLNAFHATLLTRRK